MAGFTSITSTLTIPGTSGSIPAGFARQVGQNNLARSCVIAIVLMLPSLVGRAVGGEDYSPASGKSYALLVAGADYDPKELQPLKYTQHDILGLYEALVDSGCGKEHIVLMHDRQSKNYLPESRKIRTQLDLLLSRLEPNDSLVVALAGHGIQFTDDEHNYFCPVDAQLQDKGTLISLDEVYSQMQKCRANRKLLLVDACRNDPQSALARSRTEVKLKSVTRPQVDSVPKGIVALFSCSAGQQSFEYPELQHGIFFYHVLEGYRGAGDANKDHQLTLDELIGYAKEKTQSFAHLKLQAKQMPHQRNDFQGTWVLRTISQVTEKRDDGEPKPLDVTLANRAVEAEWKGTWWPAVILGRDGDRYKIHFVGWDSSWDEWMPAKRIRSGYARDTEPELAVEWKNQWWPAAILESKASGHYKVHYTGWDASWDEWVTKDRMYFNLPHRNERRVQVSWGNNWWPASIISRNQNQYLIHYVGWAASWDEWVTADRIRVP